MNQNYKIYKIIFVLSVFYANALFSMENPSKKQYLENAVLTSQPAKELNWYQQLEKPFKDKIGALTRKSLTPEVGVLHLIPHYAKGTLGKKYEPFLIEGIKELNSQALFGNILNLLSQEHPTINIDIREKRVLLPLLHDWALSHNQKKQLGVAYSEYIADCLKYDSIDSNITKNKREQAEIALVETIPVYHQFCAEDALVELDICIENKINNLTSWWSYNPSSEKNNGLLLFLKHAQQLSTKLFQRYCTKIITEKLDRIMALGLTFPDAMHSFEGTPLSINNIIEKAFKDALEKRSSEALQAFLVKGGAFHEAYQNQIISILPLCLKQYSGTSIHNFIIDLVKSPIKYIQLETFKALTNHFTSSDTSDYNKKLYLGELFSINIGFVFGHKDFLAAYQYFYQACKKNNCVLGIQLFWKHLSTRDSKQARTFLQSTIKEFFNLPEISQNNTESFEDLLNNALILAIRKESIPYSQLNQFFLNATHTELYKAIRADIVDEFKIINMLQEETPLQIRSKFLNELISKRLKEKKEYNDIAIKIDTLPDSIFKEYAQTVLDTLQAEKFTFRYFNNRRKLRELREENNDLKGLPQDIAPLLFKAFESYSIETSDPSVFVHKVIKNKLKSAVLNDSMIVGYLMNDNNPCNQGNNYYRLYACDATDGYPVWTSLFMRKEKHPFVVKDNVVYLVLDNKLIITLNKANGNWIKYITLPDTDEKIKNINVTDDKTLFVLYKTTLCIGNLENDTFSSCPLPPNVNSNKYHFINDKIVFNTKGMKNSNFLVIDKNENERIFQLEARKAGLCGPEIVQGNTQMLWCTSIGKENIIFFDLATGEKCLEYKLLGKLQCKPQLSKTGTTLFLLTNKQLISLDIRTTPKIVWQTSIDDTRDRIDNIIHDIIISDDDSVIFGLTRYNEKKELFCFDSKTGSKSYLHDVKNSRPPKMLGTYNGTLYVQSGA